MLNRVTVSLGVALLAVVASTGVASAAIVEDADGVMILTGSICVVLMLLLLLAYGAKRALGLEKPLTPEADGETHAHH